MAFVCLRGFAQAWFCGLIFGFGHLPISGTMVECRRRGGQRRGNRTRPGPGARRGARRASRAGVERYGRKR